MEDEADAYLRVWSNAADQAISALQDPKPARARGQASPQYPTLTWYPDPRED